MIHGGDRITVEELRAENDKKKNKYSAKRIEYKRKIFDSILERDYYIILEHRLKEERIKKLELHKRINLVVKRKQVCFIVVDFVITHNDGTIEYHDTKGVITSVFKLKAKLFKALTGNEIKIIDRNTLF